MVEAGTTSPHPTPTHQHFCKKQYKNHSVIQQIVLPEHTGFRLHCRHHQDPKLAGPQCTPQWGGVPLGPMGRPITTRPSQSLASSQQALRIPNEATNYWQRAQELRSPEGPPGKRCPLLTVLSANSPAGDRPAVSPGGKEGSSMTRDHSLKMSLHVLSCYSRCQASGEPSSCLEDIPRLPCAIPSQDSAENPPAEGADKCVIAVSSSNESARPLKTTCLGSRT